MSTAASKIKPTDPKEKPLDGTKGGALDAGGTAPESTENNEPQGGNPVVPRPDAGINKKIASAIERINALTKDREEINANVAAIITEVEAMGVNRHAFRHAMRYSKMSPEQRHGLDLSYALVRQAISLPLQTDWIDGPNGGEKTH